MVQNTDVILLEEVLCQAGIVNCSIVLLKDPFMKAQTGVLSQQGGSLEQLHIASRLMIPSRNLKLHCSIEDDDDGASSTALPRKRLQWDLLIMPVTLEAIKFFKFFSSGNKTFFHLSVSHVWCVCVHFVAWEQADVFYCLGPALTDTVLWSLICSQHQ